MPSNDRSPAPSPAESASAGDGLAVVLAAVSEALTGPGRGALATVVRTSGSTPQTPGARLFLRADGACVGTVGGGAIERVVVEALRETQRTNRPRLLAHELGYDLGMCCGGRMEVFVEPIEAPPRLFIWGAGHVAQPTAALARRVGFAVTVVDEREAWNTEARFPGCRRELGDPVTTLRELSLGERDWLLIVTHDHRLDEELLAAALRQAPRYIGLVGSRRKVFRLLQRISAREGALPLDRVFAPVGLALGAVGPEEIAVSIVAELVALRRGQPGAHLRAVGDERLTRLLAEREDEAEADVESEPEHA